MLPIPTEEDLYNKVKPVVDPEWDQWNNPGTVMSSLIRGTLTLRNLEGIIDSYYSGKVDLEGMAKENYISISGDSASITEYGKEVLHYLSGFSEVKPDGFTF